jgi:hypothetical protein
MKAKYILMLPLLAVASIYAQSNPLISQVQYGATLKAKFEFPFNSKNEPCVIFRLSSNLGVASSWLSDQIYPSVNCEFQLYNGGMGSRNDSLSTYTTFDAVLAFTMTAGSLSSSFKEDSQLLTRNIPLRYFADFAAPSLQNPYDYSFSLGTNLIWSTDGARLFQRTGFLNANFSGVQLSYYNDGTPFQFVLLGDGKDRYYTGGGVLSYTKGYGNISELKSYSIEISYHKFTGFNLSSFELANSLGFSNVDYKEEYQQKLDKSIWKFNILSNDQNQGVGAAVSFYNSNRFDGQHWIHKAVRNSFHIVPYDFYITAEPSYYLKTSNFTKQ